MGGYANVKVLTTSAADGGQSPEDVEGIKFNAPKNYDAQNRCVTTHDYVNTIKKEYSGAQSVVAWGGEDDDPPVYGKVFIAIKPSSGAVLTNATKTLIQDSILKARNIVGVTPEIRDPDYLYLKIDSTVKYDSGMTTNSASTLKSTVTTAIVNYGLTSLKDFDKAFRYSNLIKKIDESEVSLKSNQTSVTIKRYMYPALGTSSAYTLRFSNEVYHPSNTFWGSVTSGDFSYRDTANTLWENCKMQDSNGTVQVYRASGQDRIIVDNDVGTITYGTGKMDLLGFTPVAIGSASTGNTTSLDIYVTPSSSDVLPLREQIILIEDNDISITMVDDVGTGTYVLGSSSQIDGSTLKTGY